MAIAASSFSARKASGRGRPPAPSQDEDSERSSLMWVLPPADERVHEGLVAKKIVTGSGNGRWEPRCGICSATTFMLTRPAESALDDNNGSFRRPSTDKVSTQAAILDVIPLVAFLHTHTHTHKHTNTQTHTHTHTKDSHFGG